MSDQVFERRWVLAEDELLRLLWRSHAGENPDVLLIELYACHQRQDSGRAPRVSRHLHRDGGPVAGQR